MILSLKCFADSNCEYFHVWLKLELTFCSVCCRCDRMRESWKEHGNWRTLILMRANNSHKPWQKDYFTFLANRFSGLISNQFLKSLWPFLGFSRSSAYPLPENFLQVNPPTFQIWICYLVYFFAIDLPSIHSLGICFPRNWPWSRNVSLAF